MTLTSDRPSPQTILLAGGGTGGHLYPGISVAQALKQRFANTQIVFLCTTREIDKTILEPTGFEYVPQTIVPPVKTVGGLLKFFKGWRETKELVRGILSERKPSAVIGLGGYAAGVAVKLASVANIPTAILNPDVIPGKANQFLMRYVRAVCCQFEATKQYVAPAHLEKLKITGCPVRDDIANPPPREQAARRLSLSSILKTLVVTGASQGAQTVNEAVLGALKDSQLQGWQILHLSGKEHATAVRTGYRELGIEATVLDFTPAMADVWAVADLAVCRSGASTCAELTVCGVPAILMPYPFHRDMHQRANARVLSDAGAAILLDDEKNRETNSSKLKPLLESLLHDVTRLKAMSEASRKLGKTDAADATASVVMDLIPPNR
jgi:UDP-N-acetylglucosamine--N-acetylmuramyl-(pentapeptide) pyrophosphoryl-undecaprenol N-acetylglucosamine transferase